MSNQPVVYTEEEQRFVDSYKDVPFPELKNDSLLRAAKGLTPDHVPVWLHRQAGRYLEEFRAVRAKHGFFEVCRTPSLACEVTLQPIRRFSCLDASIIFSDILVIPQALGIEVLMKDKEGPVIPLPIRTPDDMKRIDTSVPISQSLSYVYDAIRCTRHNLQGRVPLIGFCGAPWTLAAYMIEGGSSKTHGISRTFLQQHPETAHKLLRIITDACVEYLILQVEAGAQMLQVFESNGGELGYQEFNEFALPYLYEIPARVKAGLKQRGTGISQITTHGTIYSTDDSNAVENTDIPISVFPRMAGWSIPVLNCSQYDVISLDHTVQPSIARMLSKQYTPPTAVSSGYIVPEDNAIGMELLTKNNNNGDILSLFSKDGVYGEQNIQTSTSTNGARSTPHMPLSTLSTTLQGNIDPYLLYAPDWSIQDHVDQCIRDFGPERYIVNLGHGMLPTHPPSAVATLTTQVHRTSAALKSERNL